MNRKVPEPPQPPPPDPDYSGLGRILVPNSDTSGTVPSQSQSQSQAHSQSQRYSQQDSRPNVQPEPSVQSYILPSPKVEVKKPSPRGRRSIRPRSPEQVQSEDDEHVEDGQDVDLLMSAPELGDGVVLSDDDAQIRDMLTNPSPEKSTKGTPSNVAKSVSKTPASVHSRTAGGEIRILHSTSRSPSNTSQKQSNRASTSRPPSPDNPSSHHRSQSIVITNEDRSSPSNAMANENAPPLQPSVGHDPSASKSPIVKTSLPQGEGRGLDLHLAESRESSAHFQPPSSRNMHDQTVQKSNGGTMNGTSSSGGRKATPALPPAARLQGIKRRHNHISDDASPRRSSESYEDAGSGMRKKLRLNAGRVEGEPAVFAGTLPSRSRNSSEMEVASTGASQTGPKLMGFKVNLYHNPRDVGDGYLRMGWAEWDKLILDIGKVRTSKIRQR